jgi:capsular exopolysaccharide synthesis family protein
LGGLSAVAAEHWNTTIRRRGEIENVLQIPGLGVIPQIAMRPMRSDFLRGESLEGNGRERLKPSASGATELEISSSSAAEAYRVLRTNLIFSQAIQTLRTIEVTSPTPADGKTTTAANLAMTFAEQGVRVLLIDCDLRRAQLHRLFRKQRSPGLTDLVLGLNSVEEVIRSTPVNGLFVLTAGTRAPNPSVLLGGPRMQAAMDALSSEFGLIILDCPPVLAAADAAIIGTIVDGVLLVLRAGQTQMQFAQNALQQLYTVGARVIGAVLNDPDSKLPQYDTYIAYGSYGSSSTPR